MLLFVWFGKKWKLTCGKAFFVVGEVVFVWKYIEAKLGTHTFWAISVLYKNEMFCTFEARIFEYDRKFCCVWKLEFSIYDPQMSLAFLDHNQNFFETNYWQLEHSTVCTCFPVEPFFSTSKFTRTSSHSFLPRYLQSTDGSKWLKEYLVCYVIPRSVSAKKLNCRYGCENQFYWLSEHLWRSNFQKQSKQINPVVLYFEFWFHMAFFWS